MPSRPMFPLWMVLALAACNVDPTVGPPEKVNGKKAPEVVLDHRGLGVPVDTLVSTVLSASDSFGVLTSVAVKGEYLVVGEAYEPPYHHVLARSTGALLTSFGRKGSGPGEFDLSPQLLPSADSAATIWVAAQLGRHMVEVDLEALVNQEAGWLRRTVRFEDPGFRPYGIWLSSDRLLVRGHSSSGDARLPIYDSMGVRQDSIRAVTIVDDRLRDQSRWGAYMFNLCASPDGQRVALSFANTGRVELGAVGDAKRIEAQVPYAFRPHLPLIGKILMDFKGGTAGNRYAYGDCVATDSLVYASFRGTLRGRDRRAPPPANTFLHVFDWSGKLLRVHYLDHTSSGLDLDRVNNVLYSVSNHPDTAGPTVRRTVLPR